MNEELKKISARLENIELLLLALLSNEVSGSSTYAAIELEKAHRMKQLLPNKINIF